MNWLFSEQFYPTLKPVVMSLISTEIREERMNINCLSNQREIVIYSIQ